MIKSKEATRIAILRGRALCSLIHAIADIHAYDRSDAQLDAYKFAAAAGRYGATSAQIQHAWIGGIGAGKLFANSEKTTADYLRKVAYAKAVVKNISPIWSRISQSPNYERAWDLCHQWMQQGTA